MALIGAALSALFWLLIGAYNSNRIKTWVGAGAGAAREFVVKAIGRAPAPSDTVRPRRPVRLFAFAGMPFGIPWKLIGILAVVALMFGAAYFFDQRGHARGVLETNAAWQQRYDEAQARAQAAETKLAADRALREEEANRQRVRRETALREARERIANAPDFETQYAAYLAHRDSVRHEAAERHARSRADYLSTVHVDP